MNLFILIIFLLGHACFAQFKITKLDEKSLPKSIKYSGHIINAVRWTDTLGDNIVITTETGITQSKSNDGNVYRDAALYAYHYLLIKDSVRLTWKLYDYTKDCELDIKANYVKNTFAITDLNKDGVAEVWMMYKTVCHGDVSPSAMKIIMYEGDKKYALRGNNKVYTGQEYVGGEYIFDKTFINGPDVFRKYAIELWTKNIMETWE